jgi:hypothetical protein
MVYVSIYLLLNATKCCKNETIFRNRFVDQQLRHKFHIYRQVSNFPQEPNANKIHLQLHIEIQPQVLERAVAADSHLHRVYAINKCTLHKTN